MIEVIVLMVVGLWGCVSGLLDARKFRTQPGRLLRFFSLLLMVVLMTESHFLYKADAVTLFPDCLTFSLMMLLSYPPAGEPARRDNLRIIAAAAVAVFALSIPWLSGRDSALSHPVTLCLTGVNLLVVSVVDLKRWIRDQASQRPVAPLQLAELWIRHSDSLLLLLIAGGATLVVMGDGHPAWLWGPGLAGAVVYGILYYRAGS